MTEAGDGAALLRHSRSGADPDLIVLGLELPDEDELTPLRRLRTRSATPVFVLPRCDVPERQIAALELGADDYLLYPVSDRELALRVRNLLARLGQRRLPFPVTPISGDWSLFETERVARHPGGKEVVLTADETDILSALINAQGRTVTRETLADAMAGEVDGSSAEPVTVLIYRLRKKLAGPSDGTSPSPIVTVPGLPSVRIVVALK